MECGNINEKLSAYIDDELSSEEMAIVGEHIKTCSSCGPAFEELKKTVAHTRNIEEVEPPPWLTDKIMAQVKEKAGQEKGIFRKLFTPFSIKIPIQVAATLALCVVAFFVYKTIEPEMKMMPAETERAVTIEREKDNIIEIWEEVPAPEVREAPSGIAATPGSRKTRTESQIRAARTFAAQPSYDMSKHADSQSLGSAKGRLTIATLIMALEDKDPAVRLVAVKELGRLKDRQAIDTIINALKDQHAEVRSEAAHILGELKDRRAVGPLITALKDETPRVRARAAIALGEIRDPRAVGPLTDALQDKDSDVRYNANSSLNSIQMPADFQEK